MKKMRRSLPQCRSIRGGVQPSGAVIFLPVFGQPVATRRRTRLERVLAVFGEIRGGGPVWDLDSGGTVCVLVADCQRPKSRARLKPETMRVTFEELALRTTFLTIAEFGGRPLNEPKKVAVQKAIQRSKQFGASLSAVGIAPSASAKQTPPRRPAEHCFFASLR